MARGSCRKPDREVHARQATAPGRRARQAPQRPHGAQHPHARHRRHSKIRYRQQVTLCRIEKVITEYTQVLTTVDSAEAAERLGRSITGARLAACVQIVGPIRSLYWWQGKVEDAQEWQLLIKTTAESLPELEQHIKANHSYDEPEIIATPITWGSQG